MTLPVCSLPAACSRRIDASQSSSLAGLRWRAFSRMDRPLVTVPALCSSVAANDHSVVDVGHCLMPLANASRASSISPDCSAIWPVIIHSCAQSVAPRRHACMA